MSISPRLRRSLQRLGEPVAQDLVSWMTQVDSNRQELRDLMDLYQSRTDARLGEMNARFAEMNARMDLRFAEVNARMDTQFAGVNARMDAGFAALELKLERRFSDVIKWSFLFWLGQFAALAALISLLR